MPGYGLDQWPVSGVPNNPGAWLMVTAKNRALDQLRRFSFCSASTRLSRTTRSCCCRRAHRRSRNPTSVGDDLLASHFSLPAIRSCRPKRGSRSRCAPGRLNTAEIARAFLLPEPTIGQRIVRAKRALAEAHVPFEMPRSARTRSAAGVGARSDLSDFQRGLRGDCRRGWMRPALCEEALRLGRILAELAPSEPEVHGLIALMEIQASRALHESALRAADPAARSRTVDAGINCWFRRGLAALERAEGLGGALGPYALQAAVAALSCAARTRQEKPIGCALLRFTTCWRSLRRRPSST